MISEGKFMDVIKGFVRCVIASCLLALFPFHSSSSVPHDLRGTK
jgi:hypothetical protein